MRYLPLTSGDRSAMLAAVGASSIDDLFVDLGTAESAGPTRERFLPNLGRRP